MSGDAIHKHLGELLARIHGDGGQYLDQHGYDKAVADADSMVANWRARDHMNGEALYTLYTLGFMKREILCEAWEEMEEDTRFVWNYVADVVCGRIP